MPAPLHVEVEEGDAEDEDEDEDDEYEDEDDEDENCGSDSSAEVSASVFFTRILSGLGLNDIMSIIAGNWYAAEGHTHRFVRSPYRIRRTLFFSLSSSHVHSVNPSGVVSLFLLSSRSVSMFLSE